MNALRAVIMLLVALTLQTALSALWPAAHRLVDLLLLPVVIFATGSSQRSAIWVGCGSGLLRDAWFEASVFGLTGFKRTLLAWAVGAINARLDLNNATGRFLSGVAIALGDELLDPFLRKLLDLAPVISIPWMIVGRAVATGLLAVLIGSIVDRRGDAPRPLRDR